MGRHGSVLCLWYELGVCVLVRVSCFFFCSPKGLQNTCLPVTLNTVLGHLASFFLSKKFLLGYKLHKLEQSVLIREFEFWQIMHDMEKTQEQSKQNISINPQNSLYSLSQSEQPTTLLTQSPHALHTTQGLRWPSNPCCHSRFILAPSEFHKSGIICVCFLSMPVFS